MFSQLFIWNIFGEILITFGIYMIILMIARALKNVYKMRINEERILTRAMKYGGINDAVLKN